MPGLPADICPQSGAWRRLAREDAAFRRLPALVVASGTDREFVKEYQ